MDLRICFRVREPRDVDLILGRECSAPDGMPITSTRPGNSWSPLPGTIGRSGHAPTFDRRGCRGYRRASCRDSPGAGRGIAARDYRAALRSRDQTPASAPNPRKQKRRGKQRTSSAMAGAMRSPARRDGIGELMRITGWKRPPFTGTCASTPKTGHAIQVSRGRWRARATDEPSP